MNSLDILKHQDQLELVSDEESGSEVTGSSQVSNFDDTSDQGVDGKFEEFIMKKYKPDFSQAARAWWANYSKPSIHVSVLIEDESGNVAIETHDLYEDKEMTQEIQTVTSAVGGTDDTTDDDADDEADDDDDDDDVGQLIVNCTRNTSKRPIIRMGRRNGIIRNISDSDDEEEHFKHIMSLLTSHVKPEKKDHLDKCGHFLSIIKIDNDTHTETEQFDEDD